MKLALLVALATVAAVSSYRPSVHSVVYKPGEQYVYHYKGQILTGIPKSSKIYSGLIIDSIILLQFQQDKKVVMKLENIKLYKVDNKITSLPSESLPESDMIRLTGEQEKVIVEKLLLPIKFRYEEGEVRELQKEVQDKYWSVNIKKGILSIFQVTLKEKNSLSSDSSIYYDPTMSRIKSYGSRTYGSSSQSLWTPTTKSNSVYTVQETDISGNCETKYTVIGDKTRHSSSSSQMFVTAVRNFDTCLTRPFHIEGFFQGVSTSSAERELIQPTVHTDYVITGDRSHFMIQEATRRGKYFVFVNGLEGGDLSSYVYQKLWLKKAESINSPVHLVSPKTDYRGLQMVIPKASLLPEKENNGRNGPQYESFVYKKFEQKYPSRKAYESEEEEFYQDESINDDVNDIIPVVEEKLKQLTECVYTDTVDKKCSDILMELTILLREASKEQLKTIYNRYIKREHSRTDDIENRFSEILLDILPTLPTPDAAEVLIELISERHITPLRGSLLINTMSLIAKPTPTVTKQLLGLFKEMNKETTSISLNGKTLLRQSVLLAVGTLTHRLLVTMRSQGKPVPELITFVDTVSLEMKRLLEEASGKGEKTLILRAMGNMGASENIITLKSVIERRQGVEDETRINAIHALRRVAKEFKKQVTPILMGVFMDMTEERLIRQAAFLVLMKSNPSYATLQMIAHRVNYDKSLQIKTLVYTNLINLAYYTSHQPEHKTLIKNSRLVLKTINPVYVGFYDSMTVFVNKFSEEYDMGVALSATKLKSKKSGIPEVIKTTLEGTLFGKHRKLFEAGAEGRAFISLLRKIVGPHGLLSDVLKGRVNLEDIIKPIVKSNLGGVEHKILEIMNKMRIEFPRNRDLFANWYVKFLENELQYVTITENNYGEITRKLMQWIPDILMKLRSGTTFDVIKSATHQSSLTVATCFGIPLHLNHSLYGIVKVEGAVKITNLPTDFTSLWSEYRRYSLPQSYEQLRRSPFNIPDLKLELDVKPFADVSHYITFSTDLRWLSTGVGTEAYVKGAKPFRLTAELNKPDNSLSVKYFPTKQTMKTLHARAVPILFVNYIPTTPSRLPYQLQVKELTNDEIIKANPFRFEFESGMTGHDIEIKGLYSMCGPRWCPIMPLFGKQEIVIVTKPKSTMEFLELKVKVLKKNFEFEGIPSHLPTEELYEEFEQEYERESVNYRTASRRSAVLTDEFEPVTVDSIFTGETPIKRQLRVTLRPSTRQVPALKSQVTWFMSRNYWLNQLNLQVIRAAHQDMPDWKVIMNTVVNPLSWYPEERYIGERGEYLTKTDLILNINGNLKNFKLTIVPGSPFNFEEEFNRHTLLPVYDLPVKNALKYKYTVELDFPEINNKAMKVITLIDDAIKFMFYDKLTTDLPRSSMPNKLVASIELLPWWEKMHIIVKNPRENLYVANVPFYWNPFLPTNQKIKVHNHYAWNYYKQVDETEESLDDLHIAPYQYTPLLTKGNCKIDFLKQYVRTFDGLRYSIKPTILKVKEGCSMLTTQDCSKNGLFSMHISGQDEQNWVNKYHLPQADIEIRVVENVLRPILVNGEAITIRPSQVYTIPSQADESSVLHEIEIPSSDELEVRAKELGLTIRINKRTQMVDVNVSHKSLLFGNICGVCGNNNQDPSDDLDLPTSIRSSSTRPYYLNHLIPSETCSVESPVVSADYCKKTTHLTVRRYDNETPLTCTSERKIVQCSPGCKPTQIRSVKTCFRCQNESGQSLARRSYYQPTSVWELEDTSVSCEEFSERVEVPTLCEPIY